MDRPAADNSPWPLAACTYRACAQAHGHELMYCTDASASTGITETMAIQAAQPATNPTSVPCEEWPHRTAPPDSRNTAPNSAEVNATNKNTTAPMVHAQPAP